MTEQEWLEGNDPKPLLKFVESGASDRQKRLFALACCRDILPRIRDCSRQCTYSEAISIAEAHADGLVDDAELGRVVSAVHRRKGRNDYATAVYEAVRYRQGEPYHGASIAFDHIARGVASEIAPNPSPGEISYFVGDE